jgi:hypothetical protein
LTEIAMNRFFPSFVVACILVAGCDPDTTPTGGGPSGDAAAGSAGASGTGGGGNGGAAGETDAGPDGETDAEQEAGDETGDAQGEGGSAGGGYSHTIAIDGDKDFDLIKEQFDTSSMTGDVYHGYVAWDSNNLYIGMDGPAIGNHSDQDWIVVYIGGSPGGKTGIGYGAQTAPGLPMDCKYHVRWKANGQFTDAQKWNGTGWSPVTWGIQQASNGTYAELGLSRLDFDFPAKVQILFSMVRELSGKEWTWAGVPSTGLVDDKNTSYTKYFEFDFSSAGPPNAAAPLP